MIQHHVGYHTHDKRNGDKCEISLQQVAHPLPFVPPDGNDGDEGGDGDDI